MRWLDSIIDSNGDEFEQISGESEGQGSLACCSSWGHNESDTTLQLKKKKYICYSPISFLSVAEIKLLK